MSKDSISDQLNQGVDHTLLPEALNHQSQIETQRFSIITSSIKTQVIQTLSTVDQREWDACIGPNGSPFLRYAFLHGLEETECVGGVSGWRPRYILIYAHTEPKPCKTSDGHALNPTRSFRLQNRPPITHLSSHTSSDRAQAK